MEAGAGAPAPPDGFDRRELTVASGDVSLAGSLWLPAARPPAATVLMHPGSGASDRDNDVYFAPIREHLLTSGVAVGSFDKRGVGGSTGRWQEAGIVEQADDLLAAVTAVRRELGRPDAPVGLFGHSQGGWVVVEAAGRGAPVAFVVANAGPGVTPASQERYAARVRLNRAGLDPALVAEEVRRFDMVVDLLRAGVPLDEARARLDREGGGAGFVPDDPDEWALFARLIDHDPRPALERIGVPLLALFGAEDAIVPVDESVRVYREAVRPDLLAVAVLSGGDHRLQRGEPPRLVADYLDTLSKFVAAAVA